MSHVIQVIDDLYPYIIALNALIGMLDDDLERAFTLYLLRMIRHSGIEAGHIKIVAVCQQKHLSSDLRGFAHAYGLQILLFN